MIETRSPLQIYRPLGRIAYEAYYEAASGTNHRGEPMPAWGALPEATRGYWTASAAEAVYQHAEAGCHRCPNSDRGDEAYNYSHPGAETRNLRRKLEHVLARLEAPQSGRQSRERSLATTKLQECILWLGEDLNAQLGEGRREAA